MTYTFLRRLCHTISTFYISLNIYGNVYFIVGNFRGIKFRVRYINLKERKTEREGKEKKKKSFTYTKNLTRTFNTDKHLYTPKEVKKTTTNAQNYLHHKHTKLPSSVPS